MENKRRHIVINFAVIVLGLAPSLLRAQEINLELIGNRQIETGYRITKQPKLIDTIIPYSEVQYPLLSLKYDSNFALDTIRAAKIKLIEELPKLYPGYVRAAIGSRFMPLAEIHYGSTRSRKWVYDAHYKHHSSLVNLTDRAPSTYARNYLDLQGKMNEKKYSLSGNLHFSSLGLHQYGNLRPETPKDSIAQRYTGFGTDVLYEKHRKDSLSLNYSLGAGYDYYQDKKPLADSLSDWHSRENNLRLQGRLWYRIGKELLNADLNLRYNSYKYGIQGDSISPVDSGFTTNNLQIALAPNITTYAQNNRLKIKFGAIVALDVTNDQIQPVSKVYLYPDIELKYSMFNDILIPYLQINGGLKQNTLKSLSSQNEFLLSNLVLRSENQVLNGSGGLKGTLTEKITFNINGYFSVIKNKALFVQDTLYARGNRFRVIYDQVSQTRISGSLTYQVQEQLKLEAVAAFNSYLCKNNIFAWNLPQVEADLRGSYAFVNFPLTLKMNVHFESGRYALVYTNTESDYSENKQLAQQLGVVADLNLSAEYRYSKRLSAFVEFNNFAAQRYKRWYNYPVQGFQAMGGVSFRF